MFKKVVSIVLFLFIATTINAQKNGMEYITAVDTTETNHILTFKKDGTMTIKYPTGIGVTITKTKSKTFSFKNIGDTIHISLINESSTSTLNNIEKRILNSKFKIESKSQLNDLKSGYIYLSKRESRKIKYGIIAVDNKTYVIKKKGMVALRRKLQKLDIDNYKVRLIRGKSALDKYGYIGINGVLEITKR